MSGTHPLANEPVSIASFFDHGGEEPLVAINTQRTPNVRMQYTTRTEGKGNFVSIGWWRIRMSSNGIARRKRGSGGSWEDGAAAMRQFAGENQIDWPVAALNLKAETMGSEVFSLLKER